MNQRINYTEEQQKKDFDFFKQNDKHFFSEYGHKFLAIRDEKLILTAEDIPTLIQQLSKDYEIGSYLIQECEGNDYDYADKVMRFVIGG